MTVDLKSAATTAENVMKAVAPFEPVAATIVEAIPGIGTPMALIQPWIPGILALSIKGLDAIATGNGGDFGAAVIEWMQHNTQGQPNSPTLSPAADPSAQGSG